MRFAIDRSAGTPVNRQIAEQVRRAVAAGQLAPGERLPPIRDLARDLGVNRDTVAAAYERLAGDGVIESTVGRGTFVSEVRAGGAAHAADAPLSPLVERLLAFERTRPTLLESEGAVRMHALVPEPALFPAAAFRKSVNRALAEGGAELLLYGSPQGHPALRESLAGRLAASGIAVGAEDLVLCHGASQGISLAVRLFAAAGDAVAVEEPTYNNVLATLHALGIRPVPVPMGESGPDLEALERVLGRPEVKLFYTIPTFHNPMGTSTSLQHRRDLLAVAARCGKPMVEDAFEMDLAAGNRPVPPLAALDAAGLVVHLFSFSKSLFPGARVGSVLARGRAVEALLALKRASDLSDAMPLQAALADFLASGAYDRHLVGLRRVLASRRKALLGALEAHMPPGTRWTRPDGGYQVWVELPEGVDTGAMLADAAREGVLYAPGYQFYCDGRSSSAMRLTVAMADEAALARGAAVLGALASRRLERIPRPEQAAAVHV